jgi:hypothetical protein
MACGPAIKHRLSNVKKWGRVAKVHQLLLVFLFLIAGCGGSGVNEPTTTTDTGNETSTVSESNITTEIPSREGPIGVVAIGHSALTGEGAATGGSDAKEFSWATGSHPDVNSVYARLVATDAAYEGNVANTATGGAASSALAAQAEQALSQVPMPALAIVATVDGDIRCDGTDRENLAAFGTAVEDALTVFADGSPETKVIIVSQFGRPSGYATMLEELGATDRETGTGMCDMFDPSTGARSEEHVETLTGIIEAYEAEASRVCERFPNCFTDGGLLATLVENPDFYSDDLNHLNARGQAWIAESIWLVVADALGFPSD